MVNADKKGKTSVTDLLLIAMLTSMFLLLIFEAFMPHGGFLILATYSLSIFIGILVASIFARGTVMKRLLWISWGFVGLLLNWIFGFFCAPL